ncbi:ABC transporter substrate-binding protein [Paracoccus shandongensis]|uniref:ABC transporter substrate-binding protein n=1 Tax=Paracoccus shandongensis TaxID=2816048 RepID=UPI001A8FA64B
MIVTGAVPEQQISTLLPYMIKTYGPKVYTVAADYNFGQISAEWVREIVAENGGTMLGEAFIPLGVPWARPSWPSPSSPSLWAAPTSSWARRPPPPSLASSRPC